MKFIAGLGNPGSEYESTPHNIGFQVAKELAGRHKAKFRKAPKQIQARIATIHDLEGDVLVAEPTTFMNLSGEAVRQLLDYYKIAVWDLLVIVDDVNLPFGRMRVRKHGSAGGHNGLKSIIQYLHTDEFPRLRVGVGRGSWDRDLATHVLTPFEANEKSVKQVISRATDAAEMFITEGIVKMMDRYNPKEPGREPEA